MAAGYYRPGKDTSLKKCSERRSNDCDSAETDGCCAVIPCTYCIEWNPDAGATQNATADFGTNGWSATIAGVTWFGYWDRNYITDECEFVVLFDGEEVYRKSCYEGQNCRDSSDNVRVNLQYFDGVLTWSKYEPRPLEHTQDDDTNCSTYFCDECECSCECLCVKITEPDTTETVGEICDTAYDCDAPLWAGYVGTFNLSVVLGRDIYGRCIITATVDGIEQEPVLFPGCADGAATITLADTTTIALTCKKCDCEETSSTRCCDRTDIAETLYLTVTDLVNCTCNDWLGVTIELKQSNAQQNAGLLRWAGCTTGPCTTINGVPTTQTVYFLLECTEGQIGQTGVPTDFLLTVASTRNGSNVDACVDSPYEDNGISIAGIMPSVQLELSSCLPLVLVWRVVAGDSVASVFEALCQDPMAPPGPVEWELTVTE